MAASSKWACLPLLLLASFISLASAARTFPLDTDDHSFIFASPSASDDLDWLSVTGLKRKLSVTPSKHDTDDDQSSVSARMDNTAISNRIPDRRWLFEKDEGVMSEEDVQTKNVVNEDDSFRYLSDKEIDGLMDDLEDVGMDNADSGFNDDKCDTKECGWSQSNADSRYGWGWNQGGGDGSRGGGGGGGGIGIIGGGGGEGGIGIIGGGGGGGGIGGLGGGSGGGGIGGGGGGGGGIGGGGGGGIGGGGGGGGTGGIRWNWGIGNIGGGGHVGGGDGSTGGIGWDWNIGNIGGGGGEIGGGGGNSGGGGENSGRGGAGFGGSGGSGRNSWHWGWHWGGSGGKLAASNDLIPNTGASGMTTDIATAPTPI